MLTTRHIWGRNSTYVLVNDLVTRLPTPDPSCQSLWRDLRHDDQESATVSTRYYLRHTVDRMPVHKRSRLETRGDEPIRWSTESTIKSKRKRVLRLDVG